MRVGRWPCALALAAGLVGVGGTVRAADPVEVLAKDLVGTNDARAEDAAGKLGESADPKALEALLDALTLGAPPKVAAATLAGLRGKKDPRILSVLRRYAGNRSPELRKKAVVALGEREEPGAVEALEQALSDSVADVRAAAATALGRRKVRAAEPKLLRLLERKDPAAAVALGALGSPALARSLGEKIGVIPDALLCTALGEMLKRPDFGPDSMRTEVVRTLAKVPGIDSTTALLEYVVASAGDKARPSRAEAQKIVDQRSGQ